MNGRDWKVLIDKSESNEDAPHDFQVLDAAATVRFVRITNIHPPANGVFSLSGLRVFGLQDKPKPAAIENCQVKRSEDDPRITIVYGQNQLTIRSLHRDKEYFFRIDAFNEAGVTEGG